MQPRPPRLLGAVGLEGHPLCGLLCTTSFPGPAWGRGLLCPLRPEGGNSPRVTSPGPAPAGPSTHRPGSSPAEEWLAAWTAPRRGLPAGLT